jgi:hypothetical protein
MRPCTCEQCRLCWLYDHDALYRAFWDGNPNPTLHSATRHPLPCIHLGSLITRARCSCPRVNLYQCDKGHGSVTQANHCELCADYESEEP